jgi:hypothetical protein
VVSCHAAVVVSPFVVAACSPWPPLALHAHSDCTAVSQAAAAAAASAAAHSSLFGDAPLVQSQAITGRVWTRISAVDASVEGKTILVRARIHTTRVTGNNVFLVLRQSFSTIQVRNFSPLPVLRPARRGVCCASFL